MSLCVTKMVSASDHPSLVVKLADMNRATSAFTIPNQIVKFDGAIHIGS